MFIKHFITRETKQMSHHNNISVHAMMQTLMEVNYKW